MRQPLRATRDRAATLATLTQEARQQLATRGERGQQQPVVAKILAAIPAGDYRQKDAMLMSLDGSTLVETGQLVKVRHVGEAAVTAGTIVTPEPCGQLGLCFCFIGGQPQPVVGIPINRRLRVVGPIAPEMTENKAWSFGEFRMWDSGPPFYGRTGYYAAFDFTDTANRTTRSDGRYRWFYKMHPMRFQFDSWASNHLAMGQYHYCNTADIRQRWAAYHGVWNTWDFVSMMDRGYDCGISSTTLGPNSHLSDMEVSGFTLRPSAFLGLSYNSFYPNPAIIGTVTQQPMYQFTWDATYYVTHYRLWIDGTDATGIISLPGSGALIDNRHPADLFVRCAAELSPTISAVVRNSKSVAVDFWTSMELVSRGQFGQFPLPTIPAGRIAPQAFWITPGPSMPSSVIMADPAKKTTGKAWQLAFDANGPGGVSSIQMIPQAGWAYEFANNSITLTQTSSPFDSVKLDWNREIPEITVKRPALAVSGSYATWIFKPASTGDYAANTLYNGPLVQYGVWNPDASTTFSIANILVGNPNAIGPSPVRHTKGEWSPIGLSFASDYAAGPTQITVTPI